MGGDKLESGQPVVWGWYAATNVGLLVMRSIYKKKPIKPLVFAKLKRRYLGAVEGKIDIWLQRISHVSQFGLFVFTIGTIYSTVVPLYQKALLDEAVAKKEMELGKVSAALEKAYTRIRFFAVREYVFNAGSECSGVLIRQSEPLPLSARGPVRSIADEIFDIDVPSCLLRVERETKSLRDLNDMDLKLLRGKILRLGEKLSTLKGRALAEYNEVSNRAKVNPNSIPPPTGFTARSLGAIKDLMPPDMFAKQLKSASIGEERARIAFGYANDVRIGISALRKIDWVAK